MKFYFDYFYNPVYDFMVTQLAPYQRLQQSCIEKLELTEDDKVLCAGVGTGNEVMRILEANPHIVITGIDSSKTALKKVQKKARKQGKTIETHLMDIQNMDIGDSNFDKVLCVHVIDFVPDYTKAVSEIIRILKPGGKFAITFPSSKEDFSFGANVVGNAIQEHFKARKYGKVLLVMVSTVVATFAYFPFLFRSERHYYKRTEVEELFSKINKGNFMIEDFSVYNDFIVYGRK